MTIDELFLYMVVKDLIQGVVLMMLGLPLGRWYIQRMLRKEFGLEGKK